jgi:ferredoxin
MASCTLLFIFIAMIILQSDSFFYHMQVNNRRTSLSMMFGAKKAVASGIAIKVDGKTIVSSEKSVNLRKELIANKVDVYPLKAKITGNCGGAGICGTCAVKVLDGGANMSPMSKNEQNTLKGKPADFRLSCCAKVTGPIGIKVKVN